jgi:uncharacterized membrane protein YraQ (UPF0718 family)
LADIFTIAFWVIAIVSLLISVARDKERTRTALRDAGQRGKGMAPSIISIIFVIGLILAVITPQAISRWLAETNEWVGTTVAAMVGAITLIPAQTAFPHVGSLVKAGTSIVPGVAFLTTLTMVGVVTLPLEKRYFGAKFAVWRNTLSFGLAVAIAVAMGVVLHV